MEGNFKKIEDSKSEKIGFVIDLSKKILDDDFISKDNKKVDRLTIIFDEINKFAKLKDFFSSSITYFALYIFTDQLTSIIPFCELKEFDQNFAQCKNLLVNQISLYDDYLDLAPIFNEALQNISIKNNSNSKEIVTKTEIITRFILFYNRFNLPAVNTNENEFNTMTFLRLNNFIFDVIFLRKKSESEDEKKTMTEAYNSFMKIKNKMWYICEVSGSVTKFKYWMNLLLANPSQRVKISELEKQQKKVEEIINNFF